MNQHQVKINQIINVNSSAFTLELSWIPGGEKGYLRRVTTLVNLHSGTSEKIVLVTAKLFLGTVNCKCTCIFAFLKSKYKSWWVRIGTCV